MEQGHESFVDRRDRYFGACDYGGDLMLLCERCNNLFDETELEKNFDRDFGWVDECPYCHSAEDYIAVDRCDQCGEWTDKEELFDNEGICPDCASKTLKAVTALLLNGLSHPQLMFIRTKVDESILA